MGILIPWRSVAVIAIYAVHHDERFYPNPDEFDPERFTPEKEAALHKYAYLPFGGGPRVCIGNAFAMMEAKLILSSIVQNYRLSVAEGHQVEIEAQITIRPKYGMKMKLHPRTN